MDAVQLGPLILPMHVALALAGLGTANAVAAWCHRTRGVDPGAPLWNMIVGGFLAARLVFVLRHHDLYGSAPWSALDVRDGGFDTMAGLLAALALGLGLTRTRVALRRPLMSASLAGCAVWLGGTMLAGALSPAGAALPAVEVRRLDGTPVALDSLKAQGQPLVVNLWASWCGPCRREMPALQAAQRAHPDVAFVFVNQGESARTVEQYLAAQGLHLANIVIDPARQVGQRTGSPGYPTTLFYDRAGHLRARHVGELSQATIREKLRVLGGRPGAP